MRHSFKFLGAFLFSKLYIKKKTREREREKVYNLKAAI